MGSKVDVPATTDPTATDWQNFIAWNEEILKSKLSASLTNMGNSNEPAVESGSIIDVAGTLYEITADESVTSNGETWTSIVNGNYVYIVIVTSGSSSEFQWSSTAPTWRDDYQGWYASASSINRYVAKVYKTSDTAWDYKKVFYSNIFWIDATGTKWVEKPDFTNEKMLLELA